jgi:Helix-turn-helix domain
MDQERMPPWMSTVQAASFLGTSSEYVRREILRHRLVARVLTSQSGRRIYRISAVELRRYIERYGE